MRVRLLIGSSLAAIGFAVLIVGAIIAATVEADGGRHELQGFVVGLAGFAVGSAGLWICGVRLD